MPHTSPVVDADPHSAPPLSKGVFQRPLWPTSPLFSGGRRPQSGRQRGVATSPRPISTQPPGCRGWPSARGYATLASPSLAPTLAAARVRAATTSVEGPPPPTFRAACRPRGRKGSSSRRVWAFSLAAPRLRNSSRGRTDAAVAKCGHPPLGRSYAKGRRPGGHTPYAAASRLFHPLSQTCR